MILMVMEENFFHPVQERNERCVMEFSSIMQEKEEERREKEEQERKTRKKEVVR